MQKRINLSDENKHCQKNDSRIFVFGPKFYFMFLSTYNYDFQSSKEFLNVFMNDRWRHQITERREFSRRKKTKVKNFSVCECGLGIWRPCRIYV